eukprot:gene16216-18509_t
MGHLFHFGENGTLIAVSKAVFEEGKDVINKIKSFENSSLKVSTQFVIQASRDELLQSIERIYSKSAEDQFKEKLDMIEKSAACIGDFIIVVDLVNHDNHKSKAAMILHVATKGTTNAEKVYDCFIHSVSFKLSVSRAQVAIMSVATLTGMGIAAALGAGAALPLFIGSAGMILSAQRVHPLTPDYVDHAMNMIMVDILRRGGWLITQGTKYVLYIIMADTLKNSGWLIKEGNKYALKRPLVVAAPFCAATDNQNSEKDEVS